MEPLAGLTGNVEIITVHSLDDLMGQDFGNYDALVIGMSQAGAEAISDIRLRFAKPIIYLANTEQLGRLALDKGASEYIYRMGFKTEYMVEALGRLLR